MAPEMHIRDVVLREVEPAHTFRWTFCGLGQHVLIVLATAAPYIYNILPATDLINKPSCACHCVMLVHVVYVGGGAPVCFQLADAVQKDGAALLYSHVVLVE